MPADPAEIHEVTGPAAKLLLWHSNARQQLSDLKSTGEVGDIKLKRKNLGKAKERIEIHLDQSLDRAGYTGTP